MDLQVLQLVLTAITSGFIVWFWQNRKYRYDQFTYVDEAYTELLQRYFERPHFGDHAKTSNYRKSFVGDESLPYHYFAMSVHTLMETLFDLHKSKWTQTEIPKEWIGIFRYHADLHLAWLKENEDLHEPEYVQYVFELLSKHPARAGSHRTPAASLEADLARAKDAG